MIPRLRTVSRSTHTAQHNFQRSHSRVITRSFASRKPIEHTTAATTTASASKASEWEVIIGLEIHAQIKSKTKIFSEGETGGLSILETSPNTKVSFFDAALPGTLPVLNSVCVEQAVKTGLALSSKINKWSTFDRKHYFYMDLPHGYQITQFFNPSIVGGVLPITLSNNQTKNIGIKQIQMEMDSGKSLHDQHPEWTLIDLNRAGSGLMEIVTEPDIRSSEEAGAFVKKLQHLLRYIGASNANMEEGEMRCDVNVSVHRPGTPWGVRSEVKNINSIRNVMKAIEFEVDRHISMIERGERIVKETRFFDASTNTTVAMRRKEEEADYRFLPEPDLPPLIIEQDYVDSIRARLPELPDAMRSRVMQQYSLTGYEVDVLMERDGAIPYFEKVTQGRNTKKVAGWIMNELFGLLKEKDITMAQNPVSVDKLGQIIDVVESGLISGFSGKELLATVFAGDARDINTVIEEKGWAQNSDKDVLTQLCRNVVDAFPKEVEQYKQGRDRVMGHFVGQVMKQSKGKANPKIVSEIIAQLIKEKP